MHRSNFFNLPGLKERALTMKSLGDAIQVHNRLIARLEEANSECCVPIREPFLTFVVAGGGFAGVETMAGVDDLVREALLRMVLVHPGVASIIGMHFSGFFAWWLWRSIYLNKLPRMEKKLRVALDWTLDLLFSKDLVQFPLVRAPTVSLAEEPVVKHMHTIPSENHVERNII